MIKKLAWQTIEHGITVVGINHRFTIRAENNKHRLQCLNLITDKVIDIIDRDTQAEAIAEANLRNKYYARDFIKPVSEPLADTLKWFELAVPEPTDKNKCVQLGCHYEEFAEMLIAVIGGEHLLSKQVENAANVYKSCFRGQDTLVSLEMNNLARNELLDSLCDQIVTALGVGYMFGFDMKSALAEVVRSNFSKFENGKPVFDDNGKIKKGANYTPPQLGEFI